MEASEKLNTSSESLFESTDCADSNDGSISESELYLLEWNSKGQCNLRTLFTEEMLD